METELVNVVVRFASPSYSALDEGFDRHLADAIMMASYNLKFRQHITISNYKINPTGTFTITLLYPKNLVKYRIPMHLRGISGYLLRTYPKKYRKAMIGNRLFQYQVLY